MDTEGIRWLAPADNPWGVPVLDVRPFTLAMVATSGDQQCAENAMSFLEDDGSSFIGVVPESTRTATLGLSFPVDRTLPDGALFSPSQMEHKWAIYFHHGQMIFIRSWLREVYVVAQAQVHGDYVEITAMRGAFASPQEQPSYSARVMDYLLRSHVLDTVYPVPLPPGMEDDPEQAAVWCFSRFGNFAHFATPHEFARSAPQRPLRTHSR